VTAVSYDFAVLGDTQPEGLLVASGLVRKGFSVTIVPSSMLEEMPGDEMFPTLFPTQAGGRKVDDLLFRAGFFRLEDSGLVSESLAWQFVFPKNRLTFEGSFDQWQPEFEREFPLAVKALERGFSQIKKSGSNRAIIRKVAQDLIDLEKSDPSFTRWLKTSIEAILQPMYSASPQQWRRSVQRWVEMVISHPGKVYRVDPKLKSPYHSFLVEHARKWGVQIQKDPFLLKAGWSQFQISPENRARHLILNSVGARRIYSRTHGHGLSERLDSWLYLDRVECSLSLVPEPLKEFCYLEEGRLLHVKRDPLRDEALLSLGTWLPFEDSKSWAMRIEKGRAALQKLIPFLPANLFRSIPTLLELTEMRGECVRRGQVERLQPGEIPSSTGRSFMRWITRANRRPGLVARRVFSLSPHDHLYRNRMSSFEASLALLDHFDERRKGLRPQSLF